MISAAPIALMSFGMERRALSYQIQDEPPRRR